ncbi:methyltransferase [Sphingomonas mucosissima]|uniref:Ribosomal RNA small subunit methyltransferase C n=1 Tax=Sphingomonas mucosissima TaxID=370959 RepID=A0A245ZFK6_9SPHN|nr:methyltransferase [Sphingomonas mucosissima]OWK28518.1 ribosomal RNA small subunit methyltransferase C [Sphingomonas mucosissima]
MNLTQISMNAESGSAVPLVADDAPRAALLDLLVHLRAQDYDFIAPTPASHARVLQRPDRQVGATTADLLGWSLPCNADRLDPAILHALEQASLLERRPDGLVRAAVRVSNVFGQLFVHSRYPTQQQDAVFLGPDSYRFADYISRNLSGLPSRARIMDYGAGAGVGGIVAAALHGNALLTLADINPKALSLASVNATFAGIDHRTTRAQSPQDVDGPFDLIVSHPPFMIDPDRRAYRDGGDLYGGKLSLDWTLAAMTRLAPGGRFVMHTGVSIVAGRDVVRDALGEAMPATGFDYDYRVLDPDIFGDELDKEPYAQVDRIAAIGLCVSRHPGA